MNAEQRTKNIEGGILRSQHLMFAIQMQHRTDRVIYVRPYIKIKRLKRERLVIVFVLQR